MFFRNEEEKKRKQIKGYFTASRPSWGSGSDQQWVMEALSTGIIKYEALVFKKGGFLSRDHLEIQSEAFEKAKIARMKKMELWGIREGDVSSKPSGDLLDRWLQADVENIKKKAFERCGVREKDLIAQPTVIVTPILGSTARIPNSDIVLMKDKRDGYLRFSCCLVTILMLGEERMTLYRGEYNFLKIQHYDIDDRQWWYQGVGSFGVVDITNANNYSLPDGQTITTASVLRMNVMGEVVEIFINSPVLKDVFDAEPKLSVREANIHAIRDMINEKKRLRK